MTWFHEEAIHRDAKSSDLPRDLFNKHAFSKVRPYVRYVGLRYFSSNVLTVRVRYFAVVDFIIWRK